MKIAVGTLNPVKIQAVQTMVQQLWPDASVEGVSVPSGVSDQPKTRQESIEGATNRAKKALKELDADIGFGLEGNTEEIEEGMMLFGWIVAVTKQGKVGIGSSGGFILPVQVAEQIRQGKELGPVIDELVGDHNTKQKGGAVGIFTKNLVSRQKAFEHGVAFALTQLINDNYYK